MSQQEPDRPDIFVGRKFEQGQYDQFVGREEPYWILSFIGIPGIGKTSLLRQFKKRTPNNVGIIEIDFQATYPYPYLLTDPLQVLEALAVKASEFCDQAQFDAFMNILRRERKDIEDLNKSIERLTQIKQDELFSEQTFYQRAQRRVTGAFYKQIDTLKKQGLVLLLDTCELLKEPGGWKVGQWLMGELLPGLHDRVVQLDRKCLIVIASRVPLESEAIQARDQACFDLALLNEQEVNEYLEKAGIETVMDNSKLQSIFKEAQGHPLSLSIICTLWDEEDEKPSSDEEDIAEFQLKVDHTVSDKFVKERILSRLISPFKELTEYGVILRSFDLPQLKSLLPEWLPELEARDRFNKFISYPYIESKGGYRRTFHEFIRKVLAKHTQENYPDAWQLYHEKALDYFISGEGAPSPEGASHSPDWYYHFIASNEMEGMKVWKKAIQQMRASRRSDDIGPLLQAAGDTTLNLTPESRLTFLEEEEQFYKDNGQPEKAAASHGQAEKLNLSLELARKKAEEGQIKAVEALYQESAPTQEEVVSERRNRKVLIPLGRRRSLRTVFISLLIAFVILLILTPTLLVPLLQGGAPNYVALQAGIGVTQLPNGELIGVSDGSFAFDANCRVGNSLKCQASNKLRQGDVNGAEILWHKALAVNTNDAEMRIYLADQQVANSPHITFVVATTLTAPSASLGQDNLQGAYLAQGEYNDGSKLANGLKVLLLIANFGSNPNNAGKIARQIVQAAQVDKTIVGVMGLPLSAYAPQAIPILQQAHLPVVSSGAPSHALSGNSRFFFHVVPPEAIQARLGANYAIHSLHARTAALFYDPKDSSSESLAKDFEQDFTGSGGFVRPETYTTGQPETLRLRLNNMENNPPDLLYFAGSATDMNIVLVNLPSSNNLRIMGSDSLYQPQDYSIAPLPGHAKLYFTAFAYPGEWDNLCHGPSQVCSTPNFFTYYPQAFDDGKHQARPYGYTLPNSDTIVSYDALSVLLTAYQSAISQGQDLQGAMRAITGTQTFQGVSGQISFDENGNPLNKVVVVLSFDPQRGVSLASKNGIQGCFLVNQCSNPLK